MKPAFATRKNLHIRRVAKCCEIPQNRRLCRSLESWRTSMLFLKGTPNEARATGRGSCAYADPPEQMLTRPSGVPDKVWDAVLSVERMPRLPSVSYREIPVPCAWRVSALELRCNATRRVPQAGSWCCIRTNTEMTGILIGVASLSPRCRCLEAKAIA